MIMSRRNLLLFSATYRYSCLYCAVILLAMRAKLSGSYSLELKSTALFLWLKIKNNLPEILYFGKGYRNFLNLPFLE